MLNADKPDAPMTLAERERQRFAHLVVGSPRPKPGRNRARKGKVVPVVRLADGIEEAVQLRERWSQKANGTAQTHEHAAAEARREGALARLVATGALDLHQLAAAQEIAAAHEAITADVAVRTAKYEPRGTGGGPDAASAERVAAVLREAAYSRWRATSSTSMSPRRCCSNRRARSAMRG